MLCYMCVINLIFTYSILVTTVSFNQSTYSVNEGSRQLQPVLVLSNPSSFHMTVVVTVSQINATGKATNITSIYC